jgi:hypothetical protein
MLCDRPGGRSSRRVPREISCDDNDLAYFVVYQFKSTMSTLHTLLTLFKGMLAEDGSVVIVYKFT